MKIKVGPDHPLYAEVVERLRAIEEATGGQTEMGPGHPAAVLAAQFNEWSRANFLANQETVTNE